MRKHILNIGMSVSLLVTIVPSAFAAEMPTMNQPDNGFYEGPDPEWSVLHATDMNGTAEHRQYHRDEVKSHFLWHDENQAERGTNAYEETHRIVHQDRNMDHRQFHTAPTGLTTSSIFHPVISTVVMNTSVSVVTRTYTERPSRRSIIAASDEQNRMRVAQR